jgi:acetyl esterase/lipase
MDRRTLLGAGVAGLSLPRAAFAQTSEPGYLPGDSREFIQLWPGTPPGGEGISLKLKVDDAVQLDGFHVRAVSQIQTPGFFVYRPVKPSGLGILVIPGGGYAAEGGDRGGREIAEYFRDRGITAFVLRYRLPGEGWANREMVPLQDAQRAMRLIRNGEYNINPALLSVIGFSAGGHLSATLATMAERATYPAVSRYEETSAKPFLAGHMYPVITMGEGAHPGSLEKLLGPSPSAEAVQAWSLQNHVTKAASPSFVCLAHDDTVVPPLPNGLTFFQRLQAAGVPSELQTFEKGGHGFSLHWTKGLPCAAWPELFLAWAATKGFKA